MTEPDNGNRVLDYAAREPKPPPTARSAVLGIALAPVSLLLSVTDGLLPPTQTGLVAAAVTTIGLLLSIRACRIRLTVRSLAYVGIILNAGVLLLFLYGLIGWVR